MQTFLPYASFSESANALDDKRLGKQRVECRQILRALEHGGGWANHPATRLWRGYETALKAYYNECVKAWVHRGYRNTLPLYEIPGSFAMPPWFGNPAFHAAHRAALMAKDGDWYKQYGWTEEPKIDYVWGDAA